MLCFAFTSRRDSTEVKGWREEGRGGPTGGGGQAEGIAEASREPTHFGSLSYPNAQISISKKSSRLRSKTYCGKSISKSLEFRWIPESLRPSTDWHLRKPPRRSGFTQPPPTVRSHPAPQGAAPKFQGPSVPTSERAAALNPPGSLALALKRGPTAPKACPVSKGDSAASASCSGVLGRWGQIIWVGSGQRPPAQEPGKKDP